MNSTLTSVSATNLQAAYDRVTAAGGGSIKMPPGPFTLTGQVRPRTNVALLGQGKGVTRLLRSPSFANADMFFALPGTGNLTFADFTIDGNSSNLINPTSVHAEINASGCGDVTVERMGMKNVAGNGFTAWNGVTRGGNIRILNSDFTGPFTGVSPNPASNYAPFNNGVFTYDPDGLSLKGLVVSHCSFKGFRHSGFFGSGSLIVEGCDFEDNHLQTVQFPGGQLAAAEGYGSVRFIANTIKGDPAYGGSHGIETGTTRGSIEILGNTVDGCPAGGIIVRNAYDPSVDANIICSDNIVKNCNWIALYIAGGTDGAIVNDNIAFNNSYGMYLEAGVSNNLVVVDNILRNNVTPWTNLSSGLNQILAPNIV